MNTYRITGTDRELRAIGIFEPFTAEVKAESPKAALEKDAAARYAAGRDHILHKSIELKHGRTWEKIPMLSALGLD